MSTTKTRPELIDGVLKELGVLGVGQAASAEDVDAIDGLIDPALADLEGQEVIRLQDSDEFPLTVFNQLVHYIAELAAPGYGRPANEGVKQLAMQQMRVAARGGPTYETMHSEYF
jgi:hypothetical protein